MITTQKEIRQSFWTTLQDANPKQAIGPRYGWKQNQYPADIRMAFCEHVESLQRNGEISEELAQRATL